MSFDANDHRRESLAGWEDAASGWVRRADTIRSLGAPVSAWMLDAVALQPGERVLELAAGLGETGMMAAEQVAPMGGVIISDQAESMLAGARARAHELELNNLEFRVLNGEWIDMPVASVDVVLCRWGYMLMADPAAALGETRRVLRPGGRVGLAVWDAVTRNPWSALPAAELIERGLLTRPAKGTPSPFALGDPQRVGDLLAQAGFTEIEVSSVDLAYSAPSFEAFWETTLDVSRGFHDAVLGRPEPEIEEIRAGVLGRLEPFIAADGTLEIPARTLVARAVA
jgi:SAM-dependent methyltransferase